MGWRQRKKKVMNGRHKNNELEDTETEGRQINNGQRRFAQRFENKILRKSNIDATAGTRKQASPYHPLTKNENSLFLINQRSDTLAERTASRGSAYARPFTTSMGARRQRREAAVAERRPVRANDWWRSTAGEDEDDDTFADDDDDTDADDETADADGDVDDEEEEVPLMTDSSHCT